MMYWVNITKLTQWPPFISALCIHTRFPCILCFTPWPTYFCILFPVKIQLTYSEIGAVPWSSSIILVGGRINELWIFMTFILLVFDSVNTNGQEYHYINTKFLCILRYRHTRHPPARSLSLHIFWIMSSPFLRCIAFTSIFLHLGESDVPPGDMSAATSATSVSLRPVNIFRDLMLCWLSWDFP